MLHDKEEEILACPVSESEEGGRRRREAAFQSLTEARKRNAREVTAPLQREPLYADC